MADSQRIDDLRRRVQKDPASIAFAQLAEECRRAGQLDEAIQVCRAGLAIHPGYLSARVTLGRALVELKQFDEAVAELEHVLAAAPENLAAIRSIAEIQHQQGHLGEALKHYRSALALAKNDPDLQQTVDDLARQIEPPKPVAPADGLSLEQITGLLSASHPGPARQPEPPPPVAARAGERPPVAERPAPQPASQPTPAVRAERTTTVPDSPPAPAFRQREASVQASARARTERTITALEQWLDAIHVARTHQHA